MPYREVGLVKNASKDIVIGLEKCDDKVVVKVLATHRHKRQLMT